MTWRPVLAVLAVPLCAAQQAPQPADPIVRACLIRHSDSAKQARYRVAIDWQGHAEPAGRYDIGIKDAGNAIWPQLRDARLRPARDESVELITVADGSQYPLTVGLLRFTKEAAAAFDEECRAGFCSVQLPQTGVEWIAENSGASLPSVEQAGPC